jgi:hypothetical protein
MKLNVPKEFIGEVRDADGKQYMPVDGVVDVPDNKVTDSMWAYGFSRVEIVARAVAFNNTKD